MFQQVSKCWCCRVKCVDALCNSCMVSTICGVVYLILHNNSHPHTTSLFMELPLLIPLIASTICLAVTWIVLTWPAALGITIFLILCSLCYVYFCVLQFRKRNTEKAEGSLPQSDGEVSPSHCVVPIHDMREKSRQEPMSHSLLHTATAFTTKEDGEEIGPLFSSSVCTRDTRSDTISSDTDMTMQNRERSETISMTIGDATYRIIKEMERSSQPSSCGTLQGEKSVKNWLQDSFSKFL